jgi:arylsulfatase A-like enzyme
LGPQSAVRQGDWKLVKYSTEFAGETPTADVSPLRLYHLKDDVGETHDLASTQPQRFNQLQALWDQWNQTLAEPLWPQQSYSPPRSN